MTDDDSDFVSNTAGGISDEEILNMYKSGQLISQADTVTEDDYISSMGSGYGSMGGGFGDPRQTVSQAQMKYLLGTDEVPDHIKKTKLWALVTRHLQLVRIEGVADMPYYRREIRDIIRTAMWQRDMRKTPYADLRQIEFFAELLLMKSIERGERVLLATQIQRTQQEDLGERSPTAGGISQSGSGGSSGGGLAGALKRLIGFGR